MIDTRPKKRKLSSGAVATMAAAMALGGAALPLMPDVHEADATEAEFLKGLPNENARQMWRRRIARGLSASERAHIEAAVKEAE